MAAEAPLEVQEQKCRWMEQKLNQKEEDEHENTVF